MERYTWQKPSSLFKFHILSSNIHSFRTFLRSKEYLYIFRCCQSWCGNLLGSIRPSSHPQLPCEPRNSRRTISHCSLVSWDKRRTNFHVSLQILGHSRVCLHSHWFTCLYNTLQWPDLRLQWQSGVGKKSSRLLSPRRSYKWQAVEFGEKRHLSLSNLGKKKDSLRNFTKPDPLLRVRHN